MGEDQKGTSEDPKGIREGVEGSKGDLRVVLLLNAVLSGMFAWTALGGLQLLDVAEGHRDQRRVPRADRLRADVRHRVAVTVATGDASLAIRRIGEFRHL